MLNSDYVTYQGRLADAVGYNAGFVLTGRDKVSSKAIKDRQWVGLKLAYVFLRSLQANERSSDSTRAVVNFMNSGKNRLTHNDILLAVTLFP
jgi:hypothetical protein